MAALGTRLLTITIDGDEYAAAISNVRVTVGDADSDFVSFADAAAGGAKEFRLEFTAVQDLESGSLWRQVYDNPGTTVPFLIRPYGNAAASTTQPHVTGNAIISMPDGDILGGEANNSATAKMTFEGSWVCTANPTLVTA